MSATWEFVEEKTIVDEILELVKEKVRDGAINRFNGT
jgi:hypothetical protein